MGETIELVFEHLCVNERHSVFSMEGACDRRGQGCTFYTFDVNRTSQWRIANIFADLLQDTHGEK